MRTGYVSERELQNNKNKKEITNIPGVRNAKTDFSSDEAKSAVNTLCIDEHFCKI